MSLKGDSLSAKHSERPDPTAKYEIEIPVWKKAYLPPGTTGLAQVKGRYHTDPSYKLGMTYNISSTGLLS